MLANFPLGVDDGDLIVFNPLTQIWERGSGGGGVLPPGTVVDSVLRWDGLAWVEETQILASATGDLTLDSANPVLTAGDGSGNPFLRLVKGDAGFSALEFYRDPAAPGPTDFRWLHSGVESIILETFDGLGGTPNLLRFTNRNNCWLLEAPDAAATLTLGPTATHLTTLVPGFNAGVDIGTDPLRIRNIFSGSLDCAGLASAETLEADGDDGPGAAGTVRVTNVNTGVAAGVLTVLDADAPTLNVTNAGHLKLWVDGVASYMPYWQESP